MPGFSCWRMPIKAGVTATTTSSPGSFRHGASPPKANAGFVWRMEDLIQTYMLRYGSKWPVVCFDEASKQRFGEVCPPESPRPGAPARVD
jgi:hypothetical protein